MVFNSRGLTGKVVGLQYYHAAKVFLTASHARWCPGSDYEVARLRRIAEVGIHSLPDLQHRH